jgi:hypothetical protein
MIKPKIKSTDGWSLDDHLLNIIAASLHSKMAATEGNGYYYMTINILDPDWTKHYFTLHFKM